MFMETISIVKLKNCKNKQFNGCAFDNLKIIIVLITITQWWLLYCSKFVLFLQIMI